MDKRPEGGHDMRIGPMRAAAVALCALALSLGVAACGGGGDDNGGGASTTGAAADQPGKGKPTVVMGSKNFTEQFILGELYKQALEARGFTVELKSNIGASEVVDRALTSGKIDTYPEYTGVILSELAHQTSRPRDADAAYAAAKRFEESRGFTLLDKTPFFDTDALATKPDFAARNGLEQVGDLGKLSSVKLGAPPEFRTRFQGIVGLRKEYGLDNIDFTPLAIGLQYKALDSGRVDVANVFTTDGQLQGGRYTVLADPKNVFGFQNVAPVVSRKVLAEQGPAFAETLNAVSAKLTTEAMRRMNAAVDLDKQDPKAVASRFLSANGLK